MHQMFDFPKLHFKNTKAFFKKYTIPASVIRINSDSIN